MTDPDFLHGTQFGIQIHNFKTTCKMHYVFSNEQHTLLIFMIATLTN